MNTVYTQENLTQNLPRGINLENLKKILDTQHLEMLEKIWQLHASVNSRENQDVKEISGTSNEERLKTWKEWWEGRGVDKPARER